MKTFNNIAELVKTKRTEHQENYSQAELANLLGLKSDYLISNIEQAACSVPLKSMSKLSEVLDINPEIVREAILRDYQESLDRYFEKTFSDNTFQL